MIMPPAETNPTTDNARLRALIETDRRRVEILWPVPEADPRTENVRLADLLKWVRAYLATPDRRRLEAQGYLYPPVDQGLDPESDWYRFERWMAGLPVRWTFTSAYGALPEEHTLDDGALIERITAVRAWLEARGVVLELQPNLPPRVAYQCLQRELNREPFDYLPPGSICHVTACSGYCPACPQRPWCESGMEEEWPEDAEAGRMVCPESVMAYLPRGLRAAGVAAG